MTEEIDRREHGGTVGEVSSRSQKVAGDDIVWVLRQLVLRERASELVDGGGPNEQQHQSADRFERAVQTLEGHADPKGPVEGTRDRLPGGHREGVSRTARGAVKCASPQL